MDDMDFDEIDPGLEPGTDIEITAVSAEVDVDTVLPAAATVTLFVADDAGLQTPRLCVGWNQDGRPVVMDADGTLRLLGMDETVVDADW